MKIKEIEKRFPIQFVEEDKERDVTGLEYAQTIRECYIGHLKFASPENKQKPKFKALEKEFLDVHETPIKFAPIKNVLIIENAILERRMESREFDNFLVAELEDGHKLVFNLTQGENHTIEYDNGIGLILDKTKIYHLYKQNDNDFSLEFSLNCHVTITLYENCNLINDINNEELGISNYILIEDSLNNKIIIDIVNNLIYTRNNYSIKKEKRTKSLLMFANRTKGDFKLNRLKNVPVDFLKDQKGINFPE